MDTQVKETHTTEVDADLSHADIVSVLGLAVMLQAGIARDQPGTTVTATLVPVDGSDKFKASIHVVVNHNFMSPEAKPTDGAGTGDASLNLDGTSESSTLPAPGTSAKGLPLGGLQFPGVATA